MFGRWDPAYDTGLKRAHDVDQAKFLLKKSGKENLTVELSSVALLPGMTEAAQVVAQQAKAAGVTVNIRQLTTDVYYSNYGKWAFTQDYWVYQPYLTVVALATLPTSPYNGTHWNNAKYNALYDQAQSIVDPTKRADIIREMQKIDFEEGGFIIPSFNQTIDLMADNVQGFVSANTGNALGNFGFIKAWLA